MKTFSTLLLAAGTFIFATGTNAGVLLMRNGQAQAGNLVESENSLSLQTEFGAVEFKKQNLLWYSVSKDINTLYQAGQEAQNQGKSDVAVTLFKLSSAKEPANRPAAEHALELLRAANVRFGDEPAAAQGFETAAPTASSAEEKLKQGQRLIDSGNQILNQTALKGSTQDSNKKLAEKNIAEGQRLIDEAQRELDAIHKQQEAEAVAAQQVAELKKVEDEKAQAIKLERLEMLKPVAWTDTEKYVNYGTGAAFILIVFFVLWRITMVERKK